MVDHWLGLKRSIRGFASGNKIFLENALGNLRIGKCRQCPPQMPTYITQLELAGKYYINSCA